MSGLSITEYDSTAINTPAGSCHVEVALRQSSELHSFDLIVRAPSEESVLRMQISTLSEALCTPGIVIDEGRISVTAVPEHGIVLLLLPMGRDYAVLPLAMSRVHAFVRAAQQEQRIDTTAKEGIEKLIAWLAQQG